jgi:hypothetical protein
MIDTADTQHPSHRLVVAVGLVASAFFGALSVFHGQAPEFGAALTGALMLASATFGHRPNLAALGNRSCLN